MVVVWRGGIEVWRGRDRGMDGGGGGYWIEVWRGRIVAEVWVWRDRGVEGRGRGVEG